MRMWPPDFMTKAQDGGKFVSITQTLTAQEISPSVLGTAVAQWLRRCATNRKVAGSIPDGVTGIGPGIDSASKRNEYQEHFLG